MASLMETRSAKRRKLWFSENYQTTTSCITDINTTDRITDLPDPILHSILLLLPIKSIAQTSVLSKRWRSLWSSFPDLDFTSINSRFNLIHNYSKRSSADIISQVLSLRDKHSDLRTLRFHARLSFSGLNGLIRCAIRQKVQELDVEVVTEDYFNFPRGVIKSESLRIFKLKSLFPGFRLLPSSVMTGGFRTLHTLSLSLVILYDQPSLLDLFTESEFPRLKKLNLDSCFGMKLLKISCQALEDLTLENCYQLHGLDICCRKLEKLHITSCFDAHYDKSWVKINAQNLRIVVWEYNAITATTSFQNLTSLRKASVGFFLFHDNADIGIEKFRSVCDLLSGLSHAQTLTLETQCIEILSKKNHLSHLLLPFNDLKILELRTGFNKNNIIGLTILFKSTPTLHTLILKIVNGYNIERRQYNRDLWDMGTSKEEQFWESQIQNLKPFLSHLQLVQIHGFVECETEVSLTKFLLKHGTNLKEMRICIANCKFRNSLQRQKIRSQMMGFSGASSNAKLFFFFEIFD